MFPTEPVPERIGAYKVIRRLGGAGSADLYLGRMEGPMGFQRACALKLVANSIEGDVRLAEELAREASIVARLNHPAVVRMFDFFEYERRLVLVLEHVEGVDLDRLMQHLARRRQTLKDDAIWYIGHQLCGALAHAHAAHDDEGSATPVIHRNLQPENVLISWDGQVRLTGFGLGKVLGRSPDTVVGVIKGTPGYMAPEQARGERVTPRVDVYGLGVLLWSLVTGKRPPVDGTRPESVTKLRSDVPREIAAAIDAALEPSPDRRKITCEDIEQWLDKVTKVEVGKSELREKVVRLRAARVAPVESSTGEAGRAQRGSTPRRRVQLRNVRPSQRPAGPGPINSPRPTSRPPPARARAGPDGPDAPTARARAGSAGPDAPTRGSTSPSTAPLGALGAPAELSPRAVRRALASSSIPDVAAIDALLDDHEGPTHLRDQGRTRSQAPLHDGPLPSTRPAQSASVAPRHTQRPNDGAATSPSTWRDPLTGDGPSGVAITGSLEEGAAGAAEGAPAKPLSALASIGIAAGTAAIVVTIGVFVAEREMGARTTPADPGGAFSAAVASGPLKPRPPPPTPGDTARPVGAPSTRPLDLGGGQDPPQVAFGIGLLTVVFQGPGDVYLNGKTVGPSNQALQVRCGRWFVRLGVPTPMGIPAWSSKGETVIVPCQGAVTINVQPTPNGLP